jgi:ABC-2 type transport system permease protein
MLIPTLFYPLSISLVGNLDWGPVLGGYAGTVLLAAALISLGIFCSSLTENQIVSFIFAVLLTFFFTLIDKMVIILPQAAGQVFQYISAAWHFQNITKGILDSRNLLFFASMTFVFLYGTWMVNREKQ